MADDDKALVERLRRDAVCMEAWAQGRGPYETTVRGVSAKQAERARSAADRIEAQAAEIERLQTKLAELNDSDTIARTMAEIDRLREAGQKLNDYACHDDDCQIVTHGVWSDPIPCTCGYEDAWKAWAALGEKK